MANYAKIDIINTCLVETGNRACPVEDDGSDEWMTASMAYEAGVKYLLGDHDWGFATAIDTPVRAGDSPDGRYTDAYNKQANALGISWVKVDGLNVKWEVVGNQIVVDATSGVTVKYVLEPDPEQWPPLFVEALYARVKAGIYEGLNEDAAEARSWRQACEGYLSKARARSDKEKSVRTAFRSRILARRRGAVLPSVP